MQYWIRLNSALWNGEYPSTKPISKRSLSQLISQFVLAKRTKTHHQPSIWASTVSARNNKYNIKQPNIKQTIKYNIKQTKHVAYSLQPCTTPNSVTRLPTWHGQSWFLGIRPITVRGTTRSQHLQTCYNTRLSIHHNQIGIGIHWWLAALLSQFMNTAWDWWRYQNGVQWAHTGPCNYETVDQTFQLGIATTAAPLILCHGCPSPIRSSRERQEPTGYTSTYVP